MGDPSLKKRTARIFRALNLSIVSSTDLGSTTWVFVSFVSDAADISNFVDKFNTNASSNVSLLRTSFSDERTAPEKPDGVMVFVQRKLPLNKSVATAGDTDTCNLASSMRLLSMIWALKEFA